MSQIQISLEGTSAIAFAEALVGLPGYEVSYEVMPDEVVRGEKENVIRVLLLLKLITAGADATGKVVGAAEHVRDFVSPPVKSALIVMDGKRVKLENPTTAQIVEILRESEK
ncbi:MAG: hypothetical protein LH631_06395 [Alkalinema sp. CAN_BIN05]|nr:hypothetical protein [Alkalinema sp. CAN_BIN05]